MYKYLSRAIKKRLIESLRYCFDSNPRHRDVLPFIQEKYDFSERPQKGIIFQSASANPQKLAADNFLGTKISYAMMARIDDRIGACLDWIREDDRAILDNAGVFPSDPGVYYIEVKAYDNAGLPEYEFYVDPLLTIREEQVIEFVTGNETSAILANAPLLGPSVDLYLYPNSLLFQGRGLELTANQSLYVGSDLDTHLNLGLPQGWVPPTLTTVTGPFTIVTGTNDVLAFNLNGTAVSATLPAGNILASAVEDAVRTALMAAGVSYTDYTLSLPGNGFRIAATQTLEFENNLISTANSALGISAGFVQPTVTGLMAQPVVPDRSTFRAVVDGTEVEFELTGGNTTVTDIALEIQDAFLATSLVVFDVAAGDYDLNPTTGDITFLHGFEPGTQVIADYKYPAPSTGPFPIGLGECANNEAIPGVVLAFSNALQDGDAMAVVIEADRTEVAAIYGGKFNMSLDIDVMARDSMTRADMADLTIMYLWQWRRERLAEEGIILEDVSHGGESEEPYDDVGDDYYYLANISVSLLTDWEIHVEKPLYIRRVTPTSFEQDAELAATNTGNADLLVPTTDGNLDDYRLVFVDGTGALEVIR